MTTITAPLENQLVRRPLIRQLGIDTGYVLVGFPLAIITFVLMVTMFSVGVGLAITLIGIPILVLGLYIARGLAWFERVRLPAVLNEPPVHTIYKAAPAGAARWRRLIVPLTDPQAWLDFGYGVLRFPLAIATFVIVITWWSVTLAGLFYPVYDWTIPYSSDQARQPGLTIDNQSLPELLGFGSSASTRITWYVVLGAIFAITLPFVVRGCALLDAWLARAMLTTLTRYRVEVAGLTTRAETAQQRTASAVSAEAIALRKLERDLHDGPQQRLVRLAVDLGRAQQQLDSDPDAARATVDEAIAQARETLDELRTLSRGIAPPILTDRGLAAATAALAARATVPIELEIEELGRLAPVTEQTAYFAIAESLTNMAKHSAASAGRVSVSRADDVLTVTVADNGRGGAHLAKGHGLAGLADRLHAAGGRLSVTSPDQGGTTIRAELPCLTVH